MKKLIIFLVLFSVSVDMDAIRARRDVTRQAVDSKGNTISLVLEGDESNHYFLTPDGEKVEIGADGILKPIGQRRNAPRHSKVAGKTRALQRSSSMTAQTSIEYQNFSQVPHLGSPKVPIILVEYQDVKFRRDIDTKAFFETFMNDGAKSAKAYFSDNSNGRFTPSFDVYGPYTLPNKRAYYGANNRDGNDIRLGQMVADACTGLDEAIDFKQYDNNGDKWCDVVIIIYAGNGEHATSIAEQVWPCQWSMQYSDYGYAPKYDEVFVGDFACINELSGSSLTEPEGVGTFCHEFSHCLGLPDFYDCQGGGHYGMGVWSIMDYGCYNDNSETPLGYSAYEKWYMGWIDDIPEPKPGATLSLPVFNSGSVENDVAYRMTNPDNADEYFVIENRAKQGWDKYMPDEGMLIYHVDYQAEAWEDNTVNDYSPERMAVVAADGKRDELSESSDLFPYNTINAFTDNSWPSSKLNNGSPLRKPITEITRDSRTGVVTCRYIADALIELNPPVFSADNDVKAVVADDATSFTASWPAAANDIEVTYTLEVRPHSDVKAVLLVADDYTTDDYSWETDGFCNPEDNSLHVGSGSRTGAVISPQFSLEAADDISVLFRAKAYGSDYGVNMRACLLNSSGVQISSQQTGVGSGYKDYLLTFRNVPAGTYRLRLETLQKAKRANLKSVKVYSGDATLLLEDAKSVDIMRAAGEIVRFEGITETSYLVSGLTAGACYDWRVKAVPVDASLALPSPWSEMQTVEMLSGIGLPAVDGYEASEEYFDLTGRRVLNTGKGVYIVRKGNTVSKRIF